MFKEFYYYVYEIHTGKESENSKFFSALFGISFLQSVNLATVWGLMNYFIEFEISKDLLIFLCSIIPVIFSVINYSYLYRNKNEIIKKVEGFSEKREKTGKMFFVVYIIASLFLMFSVIKNFVPARY